MWGTLICEEIHINKTLLTAVSGKAQLEGWSWREQKAEEPLHPPKVWAPGTAVCAPVYLEQVVLSNFCVQGILQDIQSGIKLWKALREPFISMATSAQGKAGAKMWIWSPCNSSRVLVFPFTCFFFFFFHISLLSHTSIPLLPSQSGTSTGWSPSPAQCWIQKSSPLSWQAGCVGWAELHRGASPCSGTTPACSSQPAEGIIPPMRWWQDHLHPPGHLWPAPVATLSSQGQVFFDFGGPCCENQISWHTSGLLLTHTGHERLKGTQFLLSTWKGFVNSFSGCIFNTLLMRK